MNEYYVQKALLDRRISEPANRQAGECDIAIDPNFKKTMCGRFQDVDELVCRIEGAIAVAA